MKKYHIVKFLVFIIVSVVLLSACKKDDNPVASNGDELVGVWVLSKVIVPAYNNAELTPEYLGTSVKFDIRSDRSFTATVTDTSGTDIQTGTWSASNGTVSLKGNDGTSQDMPYSVSGNTLTVETVYTIDPFGEVNAKMLFTKQ